MLYLLIDGCFKGLSKNYRLLILFAFFLVMLNCSTVLMLTMQVEAVAIYCICCIVCVFGCISWSIDSRCAGKIWSFSLDRSCRCSAVCVCLNQVICLIFIRFFCLLLSSPLAVDIYFWPYWYWNKKQWFIKQALSN